MTGQDERSAAHTESRLDVIREKAGRRRLIRHPEGNRYETPDWNDVTYLLGRIDALHAEVQRARKRAREGGRYV